eukprot:TRINITY_DN40_c0_g1_i1.p1 TRINITY_DN40_c0_g1~~TRINITY_DN40_c0_g1_i1.p1  ORF type:complete len:384 (+),score=37.53 TRINITY_DN40_c0_g1_i1:1059-2210(+)
MEKMFGKVAARNEQMLANLRKRSLDSNTAASIARYEGRMDFMKQLNSRRKIYVAPASPEETGRTAAQIRFLNDEVRYGAMGPKQSLFSRFVAPQHQIVRKDGPSFSIQVAISDHILLPWKAYNRPVFVYPRINEVSTPLPPSAKDKLVIVMDLTITTKFGFEFVNAADLLFEHDDSVVALNQTNEAMLCGFKLKFEPSDVKRADIWYIKAAFSIAGVRFDSDPYEILIHNATNDPRKKSNKRKRGAIHPKVEPVTKQRRLSVSEPSLSFQDSPISDLLRMVAGKKYVLSCNRDLESGQTFMIAEASPNSTDPITKIKLQCPGMNPLFVEFVEISTGVLLCVFPLLPKRQNPQSSILHVFIEKANGHSEDVGEVIARSFKLSTK